MQNKLRQNTRRLWLWLPLAGSVHVSDLQGITTLWSMLFVKGKFLKASTDEKDIALPKARTERPLQLLSER